MGARGFLTGRSARIQEWMGRLTDSDTNKQLKEDRRQLHASRCKKKAKAQAKSESAIDEALAVEHSLRAERDASTEVLCGSESPKPRTVTTDRVAACKNAFLRAYENLKEAEAEAAAETATEVLH